MIARILHIKKYALILICSIILGACTSDFEEINENVNAQTIDEINEDFLFTRAQLYGALRYTEFQRAQHLYAQLYVQYYANIDTDFFSGRYITNNEWLTDYWAEAYANSGMQCQQVINITAGKPEKSNENAIARIWKVFIMHRVTDFWGDVPYFEAFKGQALPAYTKQEEIYADMLKELDEAATALETPSAENFGASDIIYNGDISKWIKFANSLRLRLAMRLSEVEPTTAQQIVSELIAEDNFISQNSESAIIQYGTDKGGNIENIQPMSVIRGFDEYRVSDTLVNFLKKNNDPRLFLYVDSTSNSTEVFAGLRNGLNVEELSKIEVSDYSKESVVISSRFSPTGLLIYPEVLFLKSEAALRGWGSGSPEAMYNDGIKSSIEYWDDILTDVDIRSRSRKDTATFEDLPNISITDSMVNAYLIEPDIAYNSSRALEQIITQKWLALINQGFESYAEYRRTGFPVLKPIPNTLGDSETNGSDVPSRVRYPIEEQSLNRANYNEAVNSQGPDLPTTKIWWDVN